MTTILARHPSFVEILDRARALSPPGAARIWEAGAPSQFGYRKYVRRSFYVLIVLVLAFVSYQLHELIVIENERVAREVELELRRIEMEQNSRALRTAVVGNLGLMGLNVFIAVRGVKIWHLLQRVGVENWIRTIASQLPWTRRVGAVLRVGSYPLRAAIRPFRAPFAAVRAREAARLREAAEAAARARAGPITKTLRAVSGSVKDTASFAEGKMRWALGWGGGGGASSSAGVAAPIGGGST